MSPRNASLTKCRSLIALVALVAMVGSGLVANMSANFDCAGTSLNPAHVGASSTTFTHECKGDEGLTGTHVLWHFVLTQTTDPATQTLTATFQSAGTIIRSPADKVAGGTLQWNIITPTDDVLQSASTDACGDNLNLSHVCGGGEPPPTSKITVCKWYDANGNGQKDQTEQGITGWMIFVDLDEAETGANGCVDFTNVSNGSRTVSECLETSKYTQSGLIVDGAPQTVSTQPTAATVEVTTGSTHTVQFGNYCRFSGDIRTIGYYKNNCDKISSACANATYTLGTTGGCTVQVTGCAQIISILNRASAVNMLDQLKAQLLAAKLNVCRNPDLANAFVLEFQMTVGDIIAAADSFIGSLSSCTLTKSAKSAAEALKNKLDAINNSGESVTVTVINPTPCPTTCVVTP